jgi:NAD(P)-dependent dehydrogenase (short-subunit alcohol dehydrogenase family)
MNGTAVVTGASAGLGLACAARLGARGWHVVLACRDRARGEEARAKIPGSSEVLALDVSCLGSVRAFAEELRAGERPPLRALICNAGLQTLHERRTPDGLDETFATNHLGHYLLARLVRPNLAPGASVVFVSSGTHDPAKWTGMPAPGDVRALARGEAMDGRTRYTTSKLCNVLCAYELDRRARGAVRVNAFDPGLMPGTDLARDYGPVARFFWRRILPILTAVVPNVNRVETSAARLVALVERDQGSGKYFSRGKEARSSAASYDEALARDLWQLSAELAGVAP